MSTGLQPPRSFLLSGHELLLQDADEVWVRVLVLAYVSA